MRLDVALKHFGLTPSRAKAQELIRNGQVEVHSRSGWQIETSASVEVGEKNQIRLLSTELLRFVSRGGLKLQAALDTLSLRLDGLRALDIGLSTGGFTDCLLQNGVANVVGVDVGHGQLAQSLRQDSRLVSIEGVNARDLYSSPEMKPYIAIGFDLCVVDVSFISLHLVLPEAVRFIRQKGHLLALVKPQFEVGAENLGKQGVVVDESLFEKLKTNIENLAAHNGLVELKYFACPVRGQDGNQEFFIYGEKSK